MGTTPVNPAAAPGASATGNANLVSEGFKGQWKALNVNPEGNNPLRPLEIQVSGDKVTVTLRTPNGQRVDKEVTFEGPPVRQGDALVYQLTSSGTVQIQGKNKPVSESKLELLGNGQVHFSYAEREKGGWLRVPSEKSFRSTFERAR